MGAALQRLDAEFQDRHLLEQSGGSRTWHAVYPYDFFRYDIRYRRVEIVRADRKRARDVETTENARAAFRTIYNLVREYKDRRMTIHFSVAGGRKSMSVFGMAAAQLLFDSGDRLWHLVSREEFTKTQEMHDSGDMSQLVPIRFLSLPSIAPLVGGLLTYNDPYDAIDASRRGFQRFAGREHWMR